VGPDGPLARATARLLLVRSITESGAPPETRSRDLSGADGRFELAVDLPTRGRLRTVEGELWLALEAPGWARRLLPLGRSSADLGPGTQELGGILLARGTTVRGRVQSADGRPLAGAEVSLWPADLGVPEPWKGRSGVDGRFVVQEVPPGVHTVLVAGAGLLPAWREGVEVGRATAMDAASHDPTLDLGALVLSPGVEVQGRVVDASGQPVAGAEVSLEPRLPEEVAWRWLPPPEARSGSDGRFRLGPASPEGTLWLLAKAERHRFATVQVEAEAVDGRRTVPEPIVLEPAATLRGRVLDGHGEPVKEVTLSIIPNRPTTVLFHATDPEGRFEIPGVSPGLHRLAVQAPGFLGREVEVTATANGPEVELELVLERIDTVEVELRVVDSEGDPVPGATVLVHDQREEEPHYQQWVFTGEAGDAHLPMVPVVVGQLSVEVRHPLHPRLWRTDLEVDPYRPELTVTLPARGDG
jgi:protocatechuate 3,4-dioxygenase beta subunit